MRFQIFFVLLCASCMLLSPVEASILTWLAERFWFLNPLNLLPWNWNSSSTKSVGTNSNTIIGSGKQSGIYNSGTVDMNNIGTGGTFNFGNGDVYIGGYTSGGYQGSGDGFPASRVPDDGPLHFSGGRIISGRWVSRNYGNVFRVRVIQYKGNNGDCEEEVTIVPKDKTVGRMLYTKCSKAFGNSRGITLQDALLLIGGPEEIFCAFTTNVNEIYYLKDGKWRKGDLTKDESKDQDLSPSDISKVIARITKWRQFFDDLRKRKDNIRSLKDVERIKKDQDKNRIRRIVEQERNKYYGIRNHIRQQKTDETNRYNIERNQMYTRRRTEGWTPALDAQEDEIERKHDDKMEELDKREQAADDKFDATSDNLDAQIDAVDDKCDKEIDRLDHLIDEEDNKALRQAKINIQQGW